MRKVVLMDKYEAIDKRILEMIDIVREQHGSCTAAQVGARLRIDRHAVRYRCQALREQGLVTWTAAAGSLRRVVTENKRMYELSILRAVHLAASSEPDVMLDQHVVHWCRDVIGMAELDAKMEATPTPEQEISDVDVVPVPPPAENPTSPTPVVDGVEPEAKKVYRCEDCDKTFGTAWAMAGHFKFAKVHQPPS